MSAHPQHFEEIFKQQQMGGPDAWAQAFQVGLSSYYYFCATHTRLSIWQMEQAWQPPPEMVQMEMEQAWAMAEQQEMEAAWGMAAQQEMESAWAMAANQQEMAWQEAAAQAQAEAAWQEAAAQAQAEEAWQEAAASTGNAWADEMASEQAKLATGQMVNALSSNPDPKWQNSQFLRFMAQVHTGELEFKGNTVVPGKAMGMEGAWGDAQSGAEMDAAWGESKGANMDAAWAQSKGANTNMNAAWAVSSNKMQAAWAASQPSALQSAWQNSAAASGGMQQAWAGR